MLRVLVWAIFLSPTAFGMEWESARRSTNIEDRRGESVFNGPVAERAQLVLQESGKRAEANQLPFLCPSLKPLSVREKATLLGKSLEGKPTLAQLRGSYDQEAAAIGRLPELPQGTDSCRGALEATEEQVKRFQALVDRYQAGLMASHRRTSEVANELVDLIPRAAAKASLGDRINNALSKCPEATEAYLKAASAYRVQAASFRKELEDKKSLLKVYAEKLETMQIGCGFVGSSAAAVSAPKRPVTAKKPRR